MQKLQDCRSAGLQKVKRSQVRMKERGPEITHGRVGMADAAGAAMDNVAEDLKERTNDSQ